MFLLPSPLDKIDHPLLIEHGVNLFIKRDDLIHPEISGNKWRKLKYNFEKALNDGYTEIVTFGGAYSNHIAATAAAADYFGIQSTAIIRGDELTTNSNRTLKLAHKHGMKLEFVSREDYRNIKVNHAQLTGKHPNAYLVPEGGTNDLAIKGASEIISEIDIDFNCLITAVGTGGTLAGLVKGLNGRNQVFGMSSLKGTFIKSEIAGLLLKMQILHNNYTIHTNYHFGGYGKTSTELIQFINKINEEINIIFDPIYTGKALFGVWEMIANSKFDGQTLVFLHTGGLQGIVGFNQKSSQKIHN